MKKITVINPAGFNLKALASLGQRLGVELETIVEWADYVPSPESEEAVKSRLDATNLVIMVVPGKNEKITASCFALVGAIRNHYRLLPVVFIVSGSHYTLKLKALSAGVNEFLPMPFKLGELAAVARNFLRLSAEIRLLQGEVSNASSLQDLIWEEARQQKAHLESQVSEFRSQLDAQSVAQEAMFELSRQELLEANRKIKEKYEAEIEALKDKNRIETLFGRYVSPEIVERVMDPEKSKELQGVRREITVFFADIRGFTSISEQLQPEKVLYILNEFFTEMTTIIHESGGWVDKYSGDQIMALFGAPIESPEHPRQAVRAAWQVSERFYLLREMWRDLFGIEAGLGIGLATGETIVGNVGSFQKVSYTAIGDTVNVAARLESACRDGTIMLNEACFNELDEALVERYEVQARGPLELKGKSIPIKTWFIQVYPRVERRSQ